MSLRMLRNVTVWHVILFVLRTNDDNYALLAGLARADARWRFVGRGLFGLLLIERSSLKSTSSLPAKEDDYRRVQQTYPL